VYAGDKYLDADAAELETVAQKALQNSKTIDIQKGKIVDIVGVTLGIEELLEDLNAKVSETEIKIKMEGDVLFDFDKATIKKEAEPTLENVSKVIQEYSTQKVLVEGYTDSKGSDSYNLALSKKRAKSVKNWMVKKGHVAQKEIQSKGWGEAKPIAPNTYKDGSDNPDGRAKNRRVEITIKIKGASK
jgi:outer membrane protein OmpA-like peptidoglycan-associated protein